MSAKKMVPTKCVECGTEIMTRQDKIKKTCSPECRTTHMKKIAWEKSRKKECQACGTVFTLTKKEEDRGKRFCSRECYHASVSSEAKEVMTCANCGRKWLANPSRRTRTCSNDCKYELRKKEFGR